MTALMSILVGAGLSSLGFLFGFLGGLYSARKARQPFLDLDIDDELRRFMEEQQ